MGYQKVVSTGFKKREYVTMDKKYVTDLEKGVLSLEKQLEEAFKLSEYKIKIEEYLKRCDRLLEENLCKEDWHWIIDKKHTLNGYLEDLELMHKFLSEASVLFEEYERKILVMPKRQG